MFFTKATVLLSALASTVLSHPIQSTDPTTQWSGTNVTLVSRSPLTQALKTQLYNSMWQAMKAKHQSQGIPPGTRLLFFSGPQGESYEMHAEEYSKQAYPEYTTLAQMLPASAINDHQTNPEFWTYVGQVMAKMAVDKTVVLLPPLKPGETALTWNPNSFWNKAEWPTLKQNTPLGIWRAALNDKKFRLIKESGKVL